MITIIVITMLIITTIMIMKWNLEMVKQQRTRCLPKYKKTRWFSLYLCFLLQISREFYFFLCFFLCCNKVFIYIYIYSADYLHYTWLAKTNHQRTLDLWQVHGNFFRINFITSQISIAGIFLGWATELLWTSFSCRLAHFFLTSAVTF